jgi:hypothetical protein
MTTGFEPTGVNAVSVIQAGKALLLTLGAGGAAYGGSYATGLSPVLQGVAAGTIVLGPAAIAQLTTRPLFARYLAEGLKVPAGTARGMELSAILAPAAREVLSGMWKEIEGKPPDVVAKASGIAKKKVGAIIDLIKPPVDPAVNTRSVAPGVGLTTQGGRSPTATDFRESPTASGGDESRFSDYLLSHGLDPNSVMP